MNKFIVVMVGMFMFCLVGNASAISFNQSGVSTDAHYVDYAYFTLTETNTDVDIWTTGYASGSFDPEIRLWAWDSIQGDYAHVIRNDDNGTVRPNEQSYLDSGLEIASLVANDYVITTAYWTNNNEGPWLADGFEANGDSTGYYSVHFDSTGNGYFGNSGQQPVPEPATMLLMGAGLAGLATLRKRQTKK